MKDHLKYAFPRSLPVMFGYVFLGIAFGIVLENAGFHVLWALGISIFVFAGSLQFVMVPLLAAAVSPLTMAATALFVNFRHVFYGISFVEDFDKMKKAKKPYMIFALSDETYSVLCGCKNEDPEGVHRESWFLISLLDQAYWVIGSVIGALLGQALPFDFTGIDFSMTALFVVILIEQLTNNFRKNWVVAFAAILITTLCLFVFGSDKFLLPALIVTVLITALYQQIGGQKS